MPTTLPKILRPVTQKTLIFYLAIYHVHEKSSFKYNAQLSSGASGLIIFCLSLHLLLYFVYVSSKNVG